MFSAKDGLTYLGDGDPRHKNKYKTKKFRCERDPVHSKCKDRKCNFAPVDRYGRPLWKVSWTPCREEDAIEYMRDTHGHNYVRPRHKGHGKSHSKSQDKTGSKKHSIPSAPGPSQRAAAPAPASHQNTVRAESVVSSRDMASRQGMDGQQPGPTYQASAAAGAWGTPNIPFDQQAPPIPFEEPPHSRRTRSSKHSSRGNSVQGSMGEMGAGMAVYRGMPPTPGLSPAQSARGTPIPPGMQLSSVMATHHTRQPFPSSISPFPGRQPVHPPSVPSPPLSHSDDDWDSP